VTLHAAGLEDRLDVAGKIDFLRRWRRQLLNLLRGEFGLHDGGESE
jgi:hypothetical protein